MLYAEVEGHNGEFCDRGSTEKWGEAVKRSLQDRRLGGIAWWHAP
jgi:hypothetical protein